MQLDDERRPETSRYQRHAMVMSQETRSTFTWSSVRRLTQVHLHTVEPRALKTKIIPAISQNIPHLHYSADEKSAQASGTNVRTCIDCRNKHTKSPPSRRKRVKFSSGDRRRNENPLTSRKTEYATCSGSRLPMEASCTPQATPL